MDLLLERAAAERGEDPARPALGALAPSPDRLPGRLLPQPARPSCPAACGADWTGRPDEAAPPQAAGVPADARPDPDLAELARLAEAAARRPAS